MGIEQNQVVALWKGQLPESYNFIPILPSNPIAVYNELPAFCLICSAWGHKAWGVSRSTGGGFAQVITSHVCGTKIVKGIYIDPKCVNCGGEHNAHSAACTRCPDTRREYSDRWSADSRPPLLRQTSSSTTVASTPQQRRPYQEGGGGAWSGGRRLWEGGMASPHQLPVER